MKFTELDLHPSLFAGIKKSNFTDCTPIQELAIPPILEGKDVAGLAQTGTGKTAAFVLPLIERILRAQEAETAGKALHGDEIVEAKTKEIEGIVNENAKADGSEDSPVVPPSKRAFVEWEKSNYILVLVPTRELAEQVYQNVASLGGDAGIRCTAIYGGTAYDKQKKAIGHGLEFVVATPGRLIDLYKEHVVDLRQVRAVVFDEADRMFDMGFKDDMKYILKRIPGDRQMLVFSATLNFDVLNVCYEFGSEPVEINVSKDQPKAENVDDAIFHVGHDDKPMYLLSLLKKEGPRQAIVFSNFKRNVERITQFLNKNGVPAVGISSLMTQAQRNRVMGQFKSDNERNILVATDLAARGLDIQGVDMVFNFELPDDPENYVHRIGRTGRAGANGHAYSFVGDRDIDALRRIEDYLGHKLEIGWIEDEHLLQQYEEFPRDRELGPYPRRPRMADKKTGGDRGAGRRGDRRQDGRRRRPPRDGQRDDSNQQQASGGERSQKKSSRNRNRNRNRDRDFKGRREEGGENQPSQQQGSPSGHRDRTTGRHGSSGGGGGQGQQQGGQGRDGNQRRNNKRRRRRGGRPQGEQRDRQQQGQGQQTKGGQQQSRRHSGKSSKPVASSAPAQKSIGKKVSGFFKKIFGN
ncbi:MAG: DEAD/DEAH box helicase [Bdellovibrionaceae bacterium]|nr:DEAD/DEAH box helicase [Bdellovibrionales bacterium]MCB9084909.1 DEAD/DEAH box helicase [Pseudobdellovibrionaceae bacterium]